MSMTSAADVSSQAVSPALIAEAVESDIRYGGFLPPGGALESVTNVYDDRARQRFFKVGPREVRFSPRVGPRAVSAETSQQLDQAGAVCAGASAVAAGVGSSSPCSGAAIQTTISAAKLSSDSSVSAVSIPMARSVGVTVHRRLWSKRPKKPHLHSAVRTKRWSSRACP